ncbi:MAG: ABC transporter permease [Nitrososphaerales archaeon]|jgi:ABC-type dipeptide/oligopeptide/nickel transport system permease component
MAGLWVYVIRRILFMIPVFLAVSIATFLLTNLAGNPIDLIRLSLHNLSASQLAALNAFYNLDKPLYVRYFIWLRNFVTGNLGYSPVFGNVNTAIFPWVATTLELQFSALGLSLAIGIPAGIYSSQHQYSKGDYTVTTAAIFGVSLPTFWLGELFILVFSLYLGVLPSAGAYSIYPPYWWGYPALDVIAHAILPVAVLTIVSVAVIARLVRANMLEVLRQDYILAAKACGISNRSITYRHALKNAITPVVTVVGLSFALALAGAPGLETTFSWPGLGFRFVQAANVLDLTTVQGITMLITVIALVVNLLTDFVYAYLDPRVRLH